MPLCARFSFLGVGSRACGKPAALAGVALAGAAWRHACLPWTDGVAVAVRVRVNTRQLPFGPTFVAQSQSNVVVDRHRCSLLRYIMSKPTSCIANAKLEQLKFKKRERLSLGC